MTEDNAANHWQSTTTKTDHDNYGVVCGHGSKSKDDRNDTNIAPYKQGREQEHALTVTDKALSSTISGSTVSINIDNVP
jgi:hypothetical protein